jgi:NAD(P)-dependent dehydrogenase (short-subunit alcohol dehydrogenase family)
MAGSKDLPASTASFAKVFFSNQFLEKPVWPADGTDLTGKTAIITGGNQGLGYETAKQLLALRISHLILAVRSIEKGELAATELRKTAKNAKVKINVWHLDMSSYASIQEFAKRVDTELVQVDYVLLNAGVRNLSFRTVEGTLHEETIQVNYLSTMLLLTLLLPILKRKRQISKAPEPPRITITSAALAYTAQFNNRHADRFLSSYDDAGHFNSMEYYSASKAMGQMFLWKLVDYVKAEDVIVNLADPAFVRGTSLGRDVKGAARLGMKVFESAGRTPEVGASCLVDAMVTKGKESHGCFLMSWKIHP